MRAGDVREHRRPQRLAAQLAERSAATQARRRAAHPQPKPHTDSIVGPPPEIVPMGNGAWLVDGELVAVGERHSDTELSTGVRPAGPWRHSAHRGRVLRVY
jgi:hypothetical protein